eukprot:1256885-Prymnesium_polylepis.1
MLDLPTRRSSASSGSSGASSCANASDSPLHWRQRLRQLDRPRARRQLAQLDQLDYRRVAA